MDFLRSLLTSDNKIKDEERAATGTPKIQLPGFGLPLDQMPEKCFPVLDLELSKPQSFQACTLSVREVVMLALIDKLTDKPEWWQKVKNPEIVAKWKAEALSADWTALNDYAEMSEVMFDKVGWCF